MTRADWLGAWQSALTVTGGLALALAADLAIKFLIIPCGDLLYAAMSSIGAR
jgi:hypothetical protein